MTMTNTTYLITGANRGIGRGLAGLVLARPRTTLVALVRDVDDDTAKTLSSLPKGEDSKVIVLPYQATTPDSAARAMASLQDHKIDHLDVVIANAGMTNWRGPSVEITAEAIHEHVAVNTVGPLWLFQACLPLLKASSGVPKFVAVSSAIGSTELAATSLATSQFLAYGVSKAALNHAIRKLSVECSDVVVELVTPGPVQTDLLRDFQAATEAAVKANPALLARFSPIDQVVEGLLGCIDGASLGGTDIPRTSGGFRDWQGKVIPW